MKKKIKILSSGTINALGGINGPIYTPTDIETSVITSIIYEGHKVVEVLPNGEEVNLHYSNVTTNNYREYEDKLNSMPQHISRETTEETTREHQGEKESQGEPVKPELKKNGK